MEQGYRPSNETPSTRVEQNNSLHSSRPHRLFIMVIIIFSICIRLPYINTPPIDAHAWRQSLTATVAKNFVREDSNILHPKQNEILPEENFERYVFLEFPLYQYATSLIYRVADFQNWVPRSITILSSAITSVFIYGIGIMVFANPLAAFVSACIFNLFPVVFFFGRAVLPDMTMVMFLSAYMYFTFYSVHTKKRAALYAAAFLLALASVIKPYSLIYLPVLFTAVIATHANPLHKLKYLIFEATILSAISASLYGAWVLYYTMNFPQSIPTEHMYGMIGFAHTTVPNFLIQMTKNFGYELFTTTGSLLAIAGFGISIKKKNSYTPLIVIWAICCAAYILIVASGNANHHYYQLPVSLLFAVTAGVAINVLFIQTHTRVRARGALAVALVIMSIFQIRLVLSNFFYSSVTYFPEIKTIQQYIPASSYIITSGLYRDPTFLDISDRRGWPFNSELLESSTLSEDFHGVSIPVSELSTEQQASLHMPDEAYYKYLLPFIKRKTQLGAEYILILRKEMPISYVRITELLSLQFEATYASDTATIFRLNKPR